MPNVIDALRLPQLATQFDVTPQGSQDRIDVHDLYGCLGLPPILMVDGAG